MVECQGVSAERHPREQRCHFHAHILCGERLYDIDLASQGTCEADVLSYTAWTCVLGVLLFSTF